MENLEHMDESVLLLCSLGSDPSIIVSKFLFIGYKDDVSTNKIVPLEP